MGFCRGLEQATRVTWHIFESLDVGEGIKKKGPQITVVKEHFVIAVWFRKLWNPLEMQGENIKFSLSSHLGSTLRKTLEQTLWFTLLQGYRYTVCLPACTKRTTPFYKGFSIYLHKVQMRQFYLALYTYTFWSSIQPSEFWNIFWPNALWYSAWSSISKDMKGICKMAPIAELQSSDFRLTFTKRHLGHLHWKAAFDSSSYYVLSQAAIDYELRMLLI